MTDKLFNAISKTVCIIDGITLAIIWVMVHPKRLKRILSINGNAGVKIVANKVSHDIRLSVQKK